MVQADAHGIEHGGAAASLGHPPSPLLERPRHGGQAVARPMRGGGSARLQEREGVRLKSKCGGREAEES